MRRGRFEEANGGTLFLDEVGEMSLSAQVRLLRVLQDGELTRVGGSEVIKTDVRVLAASNVDLKRAVELGTFRQDLFYRLSVFPISCRRCANGPKTFTRSSSTSSSTTNRRPAASSPVSRKTLQALITYDWPGNVRELENAIERAVIIASGRQIELEDLPEAISKIALQDAIGSKSSAPKPPAKDARRLSRSPSRRQWKRSNARPSKPPSTTPAETNPTPRRPSASAAKRSTGNWSNINGGPASVNPGSVL